jgi:diguanylate cyclase (GGDEF)-like protein
MLGIPGFKVGSKIYDGPNSLIYKAVREKDSTPVVIKMLNNQRPTNHELERFCYEYEIAKKLEGTDWVIVNYELLDVDHTKAIVMEDIKGQSLDIIISNMDHRRLNLSFFLTVAIKSVEALGQIHKSHIIHKDIKPHNIIYNVKTKELRIIDFSLSTQLTRECQQIVTGRLLEGTIAYIAPEQTGRMNRSINYRSDFYSLGVTFYELLTGTVPFQSDDEMEMVHGHIAKKPVPPINKDNTIPQVLSDIVMTLLAKNAEDRYQSTSGLLNDLKRCELDYNETEEVGYFIVRQHDLSEKFHIPEKLYGRDAEIKMLLYSFEKTVDGAREILFVSGVSGIGKSKLINEIQRPLTEKNGIFITGKFEQFKRNIPYYAIIQALQRFAEIILAESKEKRELWKQRITDALGINARVITDVIPKLRLILGEQTELAELNISEAQIRFNYVFQEFVKACANRESPLVLFLDDLQWADYESLQLLAMIHNDKDLSCFLCIFSYRDNEVFEGHAVNKMRDILASQAVEWKDIKINPISEKDIGEMISETLSVSEKIVEEFSTLVKAKTDGNPFFVREFLQQLYKEKLIEFNHGWQWNLDKIKSSGITNNVVDLLANKIKGLSQDTLNLLKVFSCIGIRVSISILEIALGKNSKSIFAELKDAINDGIMIKNESSYEFVHDKIRETVYSLLNGEEAKKIHYSIGINFLRQLNTNEQIVVFDIVNQLNSAIDLLTSDEKSRLSELNYDAGSKAMESNAHVVAFEYYCKGKDLLPQDSWTKNYSLTLKLHICAFEAGCFLGKHDEIDKMKKTILSNTTNLLDKLKVYEILIFEASTKNQQERAVDISIEAFKLLGIVISKKISMIPVLIALVKTKYLIVKKTRFAEIEKLYDSLQEMQDPYKMCIKRIINNVQGPALFVNQKLWSYLILKDVMMTIRFGYSKDVPLNCSYGVLLMAVLNDKKGANSIYKLVNMLCDRNSSKKYKIITEVSYNIFIGHFNHSIKEIEENLIVAIYHALASGNMHYAIYGSIIHASVAPLAQPKLVDAFREIDEHITTLTKLNQILGVSGIGVIRQAYNNLMIASEKPWMLKGDYYNEELNLNDSKETNSTLFIFTIYLCKIYLAYTFDKPKIALEYLHTVEKYGKVGASLYISQQFAFYKALVLISMYLTQTGSDKKEFLKSIESNIKKMKKWSTASPVNFLHKYYILKAEYCRIMNQNWQAVEYYKKAIEYAKENKIVSEEALAFELTAKFYLEHGNTFAARSYIDNAYYCYERWGAIEKIRALRAAYPDLMTNSATYIHSSGYSSLHVNFSGASKHSKTKSSAGKKHSLDLMTIVKASQAISGEIDFHRLLTKMMHIVVENAGAEIGILMRMKDSEVFVEAVAKEGNVIVNYSIPLSGYFDIPHMVLDYALSSSEVVVLDRACLEGNFVKDPYIRENQVKSILCIPILKQRSLTGLLYLENNEAEDVFTPERIEILRMLSSQIAISMENSLLYKDLEKYNKNLENKVADRTRELQVANEEIKKMALTDTLTLLINRKAMLDRIDDEKIRYDRLGKAFCIAICDIDHFKKFNDTYGHDCGDIVLVNVAKNLSSSIREVDKVARWGGEEFVILLPETSIDGAYVVLDRVRKAVIDGKTEFGGMNLSVSLTFGVCEIGPEMSVDECIKRADLSLYKGKENGRNCIVLARDNESLKID